MTHPHSIATIDELLHEINRGYGFPAVAAAVASRDGVVAAGATGVRQVDTSEPVTVQDRFHVGSISKPMASTVVGTLVEGGSLRWSSTVLDAFPELSATIHPSLRDVRLQDLLSHRAGIQPFETDEEVAQIPPFDGSPREQRFAFARWLLERDPAVAPRSEHLYSNAGYGIAAAMAERVTEAPWETLVRQRLFEALPLPSGGFGWPAKDDARQPWGHRKIGGRFHPHSPNDSYSLGASMVPAGDIHVSIIDLVEFGRMHLLGVDGRDTLLRSETIRTIHTPVGEYGLGWNVAPNSHQHSGSAETFSAVLLLRPEGRMSYAFASNGWAPDESARELATAVLQRLVNRYERGID